MKHKFTPSQLNVLELFKRRNSIDFIDVLKARANGKTLSKLQSLGLIEKKIKGYVLTVDGHRLIEGNKIVVSEIEMELPK